MYIYIYILSSLYRYIYTYTPIYTTLMRIYIHICIHTYVHTSHNTHTHSTHSPHTHTRTRTIMLCCCEAASQLDFKGEADEGCSAPERRGALTQRAAHACLCEPRVPLSACARACAHRACTHTLARSCTHDRTQDEEDEEWEASQPDVTEDGDSEQVDTAHTRTFMHAYTHACMHACKQSHTDEYTDTRAHRRLYVCRCSSGTLPPPCAPDRCSLA